MAALVEASAAVESTHSTRGGLVAAQALQFVLEGGAHLLVRWPGDRPRRPHPARALPEVNERAMPLGYLPLTRVLAAAVTVLAVFSAALVVITALIR